MSGVTFKFGLICFVFVVFALMYSWSLVRPFFDMHAPRQPHAVSSKLPVSSFVLFIFCFFGDVAFNRVAKKMRTYFEMGPDGHRFLCFQFGIS